MKLTYEEMLKMSDIQRKMKIVKNVVTACCGDKDANISYLSSVSNNPNSISIVNSIRYYTGLDLKVITTYLSHYLKKPPRIRSFAACHHKYTQSILVEKTWDGRLRECIFTHYLKGNKLPTIAILKLRNDIFNKKCDDDDVKLKLENSFFMQHKVDGTSKVIIIERPEKSYERFRYLEAMDRCRSSGLDIIYINFNKIGPIGQCAGDYIVVSAKVGVLGTFKPTETEETEEKNREFESWILNDILPQLQSPSVLVLEDEIKICDSITLPTIRSLKKDMINWLTFNNIVHRPNMHRAELYQLIKKTKRHLPNTIYTFDTLVKARGHQVLRQPKGVTCLNYFQNVWSQMQLYDLSGSYSLSKAKDLVNKKPEEWQQLDNKLVQVERKMYAEDIAVEHIVDKILTLGKYSPESKDLFNECDDEFNDWKVLDITEM